MPQNVGEVTNNDSKEAIVIIFNKVKYNIFTVNQNIRQQRNRNKQKKNQMEIPELKINTLLDLTEIWRRERSVDLKTEQ